jgi:hypothetical protein
MFTLHGYLCTSMIISPWILLRMRNVSDKSCIGNQNAHFVFKYVFSRKSYRCEIVRKNTEYIVDFPLQQWLREHTTMFYYNIAYFIFFFSFVWSLWFVDTVPNVQYNFDTRILLHNIKFTCTVYTSLVLWLCICWDD